MNSSQLIRGASAVMTSVAILMTGFELLLGVSHVQVRADLPFSPNVRVNGDVGTASQQTPAIAADSAGNLYVAWADNRNGDLDIYFAKSTDRGSTWTSPNIKVNSDSPGPTQTEPCIVVDAQGILYLAWTDNRNGNDDIYFAKSTDGGMTWSNPNIKINTDISPYAQDGPELAVDAAGVVYAVWEDSRGPSWDDIYFARSTDGGVTWTDPNVRVNNLTSYSNQWRPALGVSPGGAVYVAWMDDRSMLADYDTYFAASLDGGLTWSGPDIKINSDNGTRWQRNPALAVDSSGTVYVAWEDERNDNYDIYFAKSTNNGQNWTDPNVKVNTDTTGSWELDVDLTVDEAGSVYAAWWTTGVMRSDDVMVGVSYDGGETWVGPDYRVNDPPGTGAQWYPRIVRDPGGVVSVVWQDTRNGNDDIYFSTLGSLATNLAVDGYRESTLGIGHIVSSMPLFNFTYYSFMSRPLTSYTFTLWDESVSTMLWECPRPIASPLPSGSNVTERYNTPPCLTTGPPLQDGTTYKLRVLVEDLGGGYSPWTTVSFHMNEVLSPVAPVTPADDTLIACSSSQTVTWTSPGQDEEGDSPASYSWEVSTDAVFSTVIASGGGPSRQSASFDTCPSGNFYWRVNLTDGWETGAYGNPVGGYWNFTSYTPPPPNNPPEARNVYVDGFASGSQNIMRIVSHAPVFNWTYHDQDSEPQNSYEVRVGTSSGSSNMWAPGPASSSSTTSTYSGSTLVNGREYYVGVRVYDGEDWGLWTQVRFHLNTPPSRATLRTPVNMTVNVPSGTVMLQWWSASDSEGDQVRYYWYLSDTQDFSRIVANGTTTSTSVEVSAGPGTRYYWRVETRDAWESGGMSSTYEFTTATPPPPPYEVWAVLILVFVIVLCVGLALLFMVLNWRKRNRADQQRIAEQQWRQR